MITKRIAALDGIRGLAILLVLAGHVTQNFVGIGPTTRHWLMAFANSSAGVRLFFVLSGYLITSLLLKEHGQTGTISLRNFYWRRALRIFPAFYCFLGFLLLLQLWRSTPPDPAAFLVAGSFTWNYGILWLHPDPQTYWNLGHLWTLALEQQFYLFWPVVLLLLAPRRALTFAVVLIVWCPAARVGTYLLFPDQRGYLGTMLHTSVDSIMMGCAAALLLQRDAVREWIRGHAQPLLLSALGWLLVCSPIITLFLRGYPVAVGFSIDAVAAALLIAVLHLHPAGPLAPVFTTGPLPALGLISYSLYLWQQLFLAPDVMTSGQSVMLRLTGAISVAAGSYFLLEKPLLRSRLRTAGKRIQPRVA